MAIDGQDATVIPPYGQESSEIQPIVSEEEATHLRQLTLVQRGNVANNGFYNGRIMRTYSLMNCPPVESQVRHAMSLPAWDHLDFDPTVIGSVRFPNWRKVKGAWPLNRAEVSGSVKKAFPVRDQVQTFMKNLASLLWTPDRAWQLLYWTSYRNRLLRSLYRGVPLSHPLAAILKRLINLPPCVLQPVYRLFLKRSFHGFSPDILLVLGDSGPVTSSPVGATVALEHGTLRWATKLSNETGSPTRFLRQLFVSDHLWVTNLDPQSTGAAQAEMPGKWSAFPHPYFLDPSVPYAGDSGVREKWLRNTQSRHLILLPSSINWTGSHNKGSFVALDAFRLLRQAGLECGLLAMAWGDDLGLAQEWLRDHKLDQHVQWLRPLPRIGLQRQMANADVILDQFGLEAFGALMLRALEQSVPVVSRGLSSEAEHLIGREAPWLEAADSEEVFQRVADVCLDNADHRAELRATLGRKGHKWLYERHHHKITALLQIRRYATLLNLADFGPARPDDWAAIPDYGTEEWEDYLRRTLESGDVGRISSQSLW